MNLVNAGEIMKYLYNCRYYSDNLSYDAGYRNGINVAKENTIMNDNVLHPAHYNQSGIECIEAIKDATVGKTGIEAFCVGNAIKYLWRYEKKNGLEDVKKAQFYINRLIQELEQNNSNTP